MSAVVTPLHQTRAAKAAGVFAAVNIAARNMGYSDTLALRAAQQARDAYRGSARSPARAVADARAQLRRDAEQVSA